MPRYRSFDAVTTVKAETEMSTIMEGLSHVQIQISSGFEMRFSQNKFMNISKLTVNANREFKVTRRD